MHLSIVIAYSWAGLAPKKNPKWIALRGLLIPIGKEVERLAEKSGIKLHVSVNRLRARHGGCILSVIKDRIRDADVLVFDLSDNNPNVLLELGMALALHERSKCLCVASSRPGDCIRSRWHFIH